MTHVPGPWIAVGQSVYAQTPQDIDHSRYRGYNEREPHGFLISESTPHPATVRLIAAAPDLLDACRQIINSLEACDDVEIRNAIASTRAAIAKAKGE